MVRSLCVQELRGLLARSGLSIHPLEGDALERLVIASALVGSPAERDTGEPVEVTVNQRDIRLGERLVRSLHLGPIPADQAAR